jgi:hypothetical protein
MNSVRIPKILGWLTIRLRKINIYQLLEVLKNDRKIQYYICCVNTTHGQLSALGCII